MEEESCTNNSNKEVNEKKDISFSEMEWKEKKTIVNENWTNSLQFTGGKRNVDDEIKEWKNLAATSLWAK